MKLIAIDFDGTLLADNGTISEENAKVIRAMQRQGDIVAACSGRSLHDTQHILKKAGLACPVITGNGAIAYHSNQCIQKLLLPDKVMDEILPELEAQGYYYELYTNQGVYVLQKGRERLQTEIDSLHEKDETFSVDWAAGQMELQFQQYGIHYFHHYSELDLPHLEIYKIFVLSFSPERLKQLRSRLSGRQDLSMTTSGRAKLEIAHAEVSKGNALTFMARHLNIPLKDTIAIGDNFNDLSMFKAAAVSIAMGNAEEEVKKQSTYVTKTNNENGVACALRKYVLKNDH
ncbi:Cof-type HAD-IIB family hydrolase [Heyndrickxia acidiproducens]|uniref:Cof-type HAD-IIB family hydrolase n=1 Tax=Heyndrickxia acidiproducens TaxID=1121084 RepID=UPI00037A711C|nr:Cof-type HAD-IIB family hydrolase [Heyndrickxia acidiproducens]